MPLDKRSGSVNKSHVRISLCSLAWLEDHGGIVMLLWKPLPTATINHWKSLVGEHQCTEMKSKRFSLKAKRHFAGKVMSESLLVSSIIGQVFLMIVYPAHAQAIWLGSAKVHPEFALLFLGKRSFYRPLRKKWHLGGCLSSRCKVFI